ncbi:LOW QUALITY PROTEIN: hypothetical protein HID58_002154, partial [Brassica napus]
MREVIKGNVTFKIWDASGQSRFRSSWERFVHVGPFVLLQLMLQILTICLSRKMNSITCARLRLTIALFLQLYTLQKQHKSHQIMGLQLFTDREVCCFMISCKNNANID